MGSTRFIAFALPNFIDSMFSVHLENKNIKIVNILS
jgi:hypothetical protein